MEMFDILEDIWKIIWAPLAILLGLGVWKLIDIIIYLFGLMMG